MFQCHQAFLVEELLDGVAVLSVHQHLNTLAQEWTTDLPPFDTKNALFSSDAGNLHQFFDAGLSFGQFEFERSGCHLEGIKKLGKTELGQYYQQGTANHNQQGWRIDEHAWRCAQDNGRRNQKNGADEADKGGEIHSNSRTVQVTIKGAGEYSLVDY